MPLKINVFANLIALCKTKSVFAIFHMLIQMDYVKNVPQIVINAQLKLIVKYVNMDIILIKMGFAHLIFQLRTRRNWKKLTFRFKILSQVIIKIPNLKVSLGQFNLVLNIVFNAHLLQSALNAKMDINQMVYTIVLVYVIRMLHAIAINNHIYATKLEQTQFIAIQDNIKITMEQQYHAHRIVVYYLQVQLAPFANQQMDFLIQQTVLVFLNVQVHLQRTLQIIVVSAVLIVVYLESNAFVTQVLEIKELIVQDVLQIVIVAPLKHNALLVSQNTTYLLMVLVFLHVLLHLFLTIQLNLAIVLLIAPNNHPINVFVTQVLLMQEVNVNHVLKIVINAPRQINVLLASQNITYLLMVLVFLRVLLHLNLMILLNPVFVDLIAPYHQMLTKINVFVTMVLQIQVVIAYHVLQIAIHAPLKNNALLASQNITYLLMVLVFLHVLLHLNLMIQLNLVFVDLIARYLQKSNALVTQVLQTKQVIVYHVLQIAIYAHLKHNAPLVSQNITYLLMVLVFLHVLLHLFLMIQLNLVFVVLIAPYHQEINVLAILVILMFLAVVQHVLQIALIALHKKPVRYVPQDITYFQMELVLIRVHLLFQLINLTNHVLVVLIVHYQQMHVLVILATQIQEVIAYHVDQIVINVQHNQLALHVLQDIYCLQMVLVFLNAHPHLLQILLIQNVSVVVIVLYKSKIILFQYLKSDEFILIQQNLNLSLQRLIFRCFRCLLIVPFQL
ncbi:transmembrane protein, putative (macronuclear) [Tetrahymena thermophila SB210]|uniref:Transmembrane protein, putative n=1 Tax=Tetrahymena thermophila (strain SB210) TaxID=312017 RepID=W7X4V2_TETTS|nr:transmembrane protein, putative [Tetrahymena thermophila SB210]EWS71408.1 transmembrane protein, putative [Tetrahymena thermophila SB210]|eukprot:XP_012656060.1 transmembrane protein, putative [Tetrahymena thermophila SB210]